VRVPHSGQDRLLEPLASRLKIPQLGMSVESATITEWLVQDGQRIEVGDALYVLETDKTDNEISSPVAGTIRIIGEVGSRYDVGTVIAEVN
jgi:pyruvate/2-oxoglutarate dehydrogenase complex dihydrolipoamide acyltransferase (E2) component